MCRKTYREIIITHTAVAHSVPISTSKMKSFANLNNYFHNSLNLWAVHIEIFSPGWNFNSLNLDKILSRMIRENSVKIKLRYMQKLHHGKPSRNLFHHSLNKRSWILILCKEIENKSCNQKLEPIRAEYCAGVFTLEK